MKTTWKRRLLFQSVGLFLLVLVAGMAMAADKGAARKRVLVVMSYHHGNEGETEVARGLEKNLPGTEFRYVYLNTKFDYAGGRKKGAKALAVFREYRPDAVVAVDDPAQVFFVVPYLADRVKTPVIFCGVNFEAGKYHYPATNVTGVLEKKHFRESLGFARMVVPALRRVALIYKDNQSNRVNLAQIAQEEAGYPLPITGKYAVGSLKELKALVVRLQAEVGGLLLCNLSGIVNDRGEVLDGDEALRLFLVDCPMPSIGTSSWEIRAGVLCGVAKSDEEQGTLSAAFLKKIWAGAAVADLPITQNRNGRRLINLATLKKLDLTLSPEVVMGTELLLPGRK